MLIAVGLTAGLVGVAVGWELAAAVDPRIPTPSGLIRRSGRCQRLVRHFLAREAPVGAATVLRLPERHTGGPNVSA